MRGAVFKFWRRYGWFVSLACLLWASTPALASEADRYLFDRASEVYKVFGEIRHKPTPARPKNTMRSLASVSPLFGQQRAANAFDGSLASKIRDALRAGVVSPSDIQLPDSASHGTQDSSKN
jgi:hypothetical protein